MQRKIRIRCSANETRRCDQGFAPPPFHCVPVRHSKLPNNIKHGCSYTQKPWTPDRKSGLVLRNRGSNDSQRLPQGKPRKMRGIASRTAQQQHTPRDCCHVASETHLFICKPALVLGNQASNRGGHTNEAGQSILSVYEGVCPHGRTNAMHCVHAQAITWSMCKGIHGWRAGGAGADTGTAGAGVAKSKARSA